MITVIIVTKNMAGALRGISLPSLLKQDMSCFEVIIWDASDSDETHQLAGEFSPKFKKMDVDLLYFRAPRTGIASQRNDSVSSARGDVIFFIDDDSDVSPDGVRAIRDCFKNDSSLMGAGLRLVKSASVLEKEKNRGVIRKFFASAFQSNSKRKATLSGSSRGLYSGGPAEWLSGCSMAFRKEVFCREKLDERLEAFAPYALGEDLEFSHRVFLKYNYPLMIAPEGHIDHKTAPGARYDATGKKAAARFFNRYLIMRTTSVRNPLLGRLLFIWAILSIWKKEGMESGFGIATKGLKIALEEIGKVT